MNKNTNLVTKVKVEQFHPQLKSLITKKLLTSILVDKDLSTVTLKSNIHLGLAQSYHLVYITF